MKEEDLDDILFIPEESKLLEKVKLKISENVYKRMQDRQLSMRKISDQIQGIGSAQVSRIVNGENYNINTLIKVLDFLDLELKIVSKQK